MADMNHAAACGFYCGSCVHITTLCKGCAASEGQPFWASAMPGGVCPLFDCCRNAKGLEHCGLCPQLPCATFLELRDPSLGDEEFKESLERRICNLRRRAEIGTEAWLEEVTAG